MQKRLFVAIKIEPSQTLIDIYKNLKYICQYDKIAWVAPDNLHLTLYFLGNTDEFLIKDISYQLKDATATFSPFNIAILNIGVFGSSYNPKVIWLGINPIYSVNLLSNTISNNFAKIGYVPDRQNFVPHITLGRIKHIDDKKLFQKQLDEIKPSFIQNASVNEIFLFESVFTKEGAIYNLIETFKLKAN